jgi:hypothetical protein
MASFPCVVLRPGCHRGLNCPSLVARRARAAPAPNEQNPVATVRRADCNACALALLVPPVRTCRDRYAGAALCAESPIRGASWQAPQPVFS